VIRLWHRVGVFRLLSVLLLVGGVAGGLLVASDRQTQRSDSNPVASNEQQILPNGLAAEREQEDRASRDDAQRKADEAAVTAAEQAKAAETKPAKPASPPRQSYPIPSSCNGLTGNRATGCAMMLAAGYGLDQWPCLERLWTKESGWNHLARNKNSGAYGIPQALPPEKMGTGWRTEPVVQIRWGLGYVKGRYQTPCGAWSFFQSHNWY